MYCGAPPGRPRRRIERSSDGFRLNELIASNLCASQFLDFEVGDKREIQGDEWVVVGRFDQGQEKAVRANPTLGRKTVSSSPSRRSGGSE